MRNVQSEVGGAFVAGLIVGAVLFGDWYFASVFACGVATLALGLAALSEATNG